MTFRAIVSALFIVGWTVEFLTTANASGAEMAKPLKLIESRRIWDAAPHNAFTDLIRFKGRWYCSFREGNSHVSEDGRLRVLVSDDGQLWQSTALLGRPTGDARDAKLSITSDGRLMLNGAVRLGDTFQSVAWFSEDGVQWTEGKEIGESNVWIWSVTWQGKRGYGVGYDCGKEEFARLYQTSDGQKWESLVTDLFPSRGAPNETSLTFAADKNCYCLMRRDGGNRIGQFGVARPPYQQWEWKSIGHQIGGPKLIQLPDGRFLATVRLYDGGARTSVCLIDPKSGALTEAQALPSGGDTSYAGMVLHEGIIWISYYSSHESKTSIYLAKVKI